VSKQETKLEGVEHLGISSRDLMKNVTIDPSIRELIGKSRPAGLAFSIAGPVTGRTSVPELRASTQASVWAVSSDRTKYVLSFR
jgi:hypothetical protein